MEPDLSSWSVAALVHQLFLIVLELAHRFHVPLPGPCESSGHSNRSQAGQQSRSFERRFNCVFCDRPCFRREPGHKHHRCPEHNRVR